MRNFMFAFVFLGIALCVSGGEYLIDIGPVAEEGFYEMKLGDITTFEVTAYKIEGVSKDSVNLEEKVWWEYDKRLLEKISSTTNTIRLRAVREGATELGATAIVKNNHCHKKIRLTIIR